ncbi:hypothetical protein [Actinoplanes rectilineatus]|uniref:hypothetical protein n=1 Tax=Actinoplanes rectilineatus TaxID=113571 RepID=UPI0005F2BF02|nr:hypothetical protein [Actinoplanes rectilineatus]
MKAKHQVIRWENPPPSKVTVPAGRQPGSQYDDIASLLRDEPGRWAVIHEYKEKARATSASTTVKQAQVLCFAPAGSFEAVVRSINGVSVVYARFLGGGGPW